MLDAAIGAGKGKLTGENALLRGLHGRLRPGDILLADSYYSSFDEVVTLLAMGVDVVMRQHGGRRSDFRRGTRLGREDHLVEWQRSRNRRAWMSREEFAALPRVLTDARAAGAGRQAGVPDPGVRGGDHPARPRGVPAARSWRGSTGPRWHAELDIRSIKQTMKMDVLRCKTPAMVRKEIWAHLLAYNLIRGVMAEAARRHGVPPRQLSFQGARQMLEGFRGELGRAAARRRRGPDGGGAAGDRVSSGGGPAGPGRAAGGEAPAQGVPADAGAAAARPKAFGESSLGIGVSAIHPETRLYRLTSSAR